MGVLSSNLCGPCMFMTGMGLRMGNGISPCFFTLLRGGVGQAITKSFLFFGDEIVYFIIYAKFMAFTLMGTPTTQSLRVKTGSLATIIIEGGINSEQSSQYCTKPLSSWHCNN